MREIKSKDIFCNVISTSKFREKAKFIEMCWLY